MKYEYELTLIILKTIFKNAFLIFRITSNYFQKYCEISKWNCEVCSSGQNDGMKEKNEKKILLSIDFQNV